MSDTPTPPAEPSQPNPLRSVYTSNFPAILNQLGISLVVTTYQAGKVILVRREAPSAGKEGEGLNTHFVNYKKPMGLAADNNHMAIGSGNSIWMLRNMNAVAAKLEPAGQHDACFMPRRVHVTGDIDIHEMSWGIGEELWFLNTRFSTLCTLDEISSFVPRWRPPFISALAPEDRCHLNGLCMQNGKPKYVTLLGQTDTAGGWRENKRDGGLLMDIETNQVLLTGLSMPHSPRLYNGDFWLLESGEGGLARVDLQRNSWQNIALLPGFTRGVSFVGRLAFIGLSKVRESAVFSGIPLVERLEERTCGVWVVDIHTGQTVAFLRFEEGVQEIFAVQVLPSRFPALLDWNDERLNNSYALPDSAMADVALAE
jgi:uncharacterized protein (TIGR03032 family)